MICYLVYFVGLILHRKYNLLAIITGILVLLGILAANLFFPIYLRTFYNVYNNPSQTAAAEMFADIHLFIQLVLAILFFIHNVVFSFSKKKMWMDDGAEDTLSVEKGAAFASYVPKDTKEKKPTKGKKDQEVVFKF